LAVEPQQRKKTPEEKNDTTKTPDGQPRELKVAGEQSGKKGNRDHGVMTKNHYHGKKKVENEQKD